MSTTERETPAPEGANRFSRRDFLRIFGAGIVVTFTAGDWTLAAAQEGRRAYPTDFNAYLRVGEDGRVTVYSGKIEMGQGIVTSLAQMAAEELGVPLGSVDMVMGDTKTCPWDMGTFGSMSTRFFGPALRGAAAEARVVLTDLAAERLGVARERLAVAAGVVSVTGDPAKRVTFGELARGAAIQRHMTGKPVLRTPAEWTVCGTSPQRTDARAKVTGAAKYTGDIRRPGMLVARVLTPPAHGATLKRVDTSAAAALPGVTVVNRDGLVAVLHADPEQAARALAAIVAEWDVPAATVDDTTIFDHLVQAAPPPQEEERFGDPVAAAKGAAAVIEHRYVNGYGAHAPMETHTALAEVADGTVTVWMSTQTPFPNAQGIAQAMGLPAASVRVITPFVGGGFGGKSGVGLQAVHAVRLAQAVGKPVQVQWTRAEEFHHDAFRPAAIVNVRAGVDAAGRPVSWEHDVWWAGTRSTERFYDLPNHVVRAHGGWYRDEGHAHPFALGPWRAPGANLNVFARESHVDVLAARAKADPLAFRLANTSDPRMRAVLTAAAKRFGWTPAPAPSGRGVGIACGIDAGTYVALCAEVKVDRASGAVTVVRVVAAQEMGQVIDPEGARMQMEGCIAMGLGYALTERLRFRGGEVLDRGFGTYRLPRFSMMPAIDAFLVPNDALAPQGGGEPAIVPVGGVLANAIFDAVGARVLEMPMTPDLVKLAMRD